MIPQTEKETVQTLDAHRLTRLPVLVVHAHTSCNCRCIMCDIWKISESTSLDPQDLKPHLDSIRALNVQWIVFTGGEPLLSRALPEMCKILRPERIHLTLLTTGLLIKKYAREVAESFDDVVISLDGPAQVHDAIRRVPHGFAVIADGIASVRALRPHFCITARCTLQKSNFRCLRATVRAAKELNLDAISFLAVDLTSQAFNRNLLWPGEKQNEIGLSIDDLSALESEIDALIQENAADFASGFVAESPDKLRRIVRHFRAHLGLERAQSPKCNAPWTSAVLEVDGTVRPCFFHAPIGSIVHGSLDDVINSAKAREFRASLDITTNPICNRCVCSLNYHS